MARPWRIQFPQAVYHVMARGNNRQDIFFTAADYSDFLDLLGRFVQRFHLHLFAFCLMPNHYHLFLRTPKANLAEAMKWLNATYTARINRRQRRAGHLFQGRYKSVLVADEAHWFHLSVYLHLNPVRAGLVENPADYEWSSCRDYILPRSRFDWLHHAEILAQYGSSESVQRSHYRRESLGLTEKGLSFWQEWSRRILQSSEEAMQSLVKKYPPAGKRRSVPEFKRLAGLETDAKPELARVAAVFGAQVENLLRQGRGNVPRLAAYCHLVENCGLRVSAVAEVMGVGDSTVSMGVRKFKQMLETDRKLAGNFRTLIEN